MKKMTSSMTLEIPQILKYIQSAQNITNQYFSGFSLPGTPPQKVKSFTLKKNIYILLLLCVWFVIYVKQSLLYILFIEIKISLLWIGFPLFISVLNYLRYHLILMCAPWFREIIWRIELNTSLLTRTKLTIIYHCASSRSHITDLHH